MCIRDSLSGLQAAQLGLQTTQHNIANAKTAGYTRQQTVQASNDAMKTGAGFVGQGTHVATIERVYSQFLTNQVTRSQSSASAVSYTHLRWCRSIGGRQQPRHPPPPRSPPARPRDR